MKSCLAGGEGGASTAIICSRDCPDRAVGGSRTEASAGEGAQDVFLRDAEPFVHPRGKTAACVTRTCGRPVVSGSREWQGRSGGGCDSPCLSRSSLGKEQPCRDDSRLTQEPEGSRRPWAVVTAQQGASQGPGRVPHFHQHTQAVCGWLWGGGGGGVSGDLDRCRRMGCVGDTAVRPAWSGVGGGLSVTRGEEMQGSCCLPRLPRWPDPA